MPSHGAVPIGRKSTNTLFILLAKTEDTLARRGLFSQFSLTHPFKHSNEAFKATFGAQKTHVFIGSVLTRSSVVTQCRTACNVELLAMSNYLQCLLAMSNCLQCRTSCNVELLAVCACIVELLAVSNYLQCRTACNVELLAMLN